MWWFGGTAAVFGWLELARRSPVTAAVVAVVVVGLVGWLVIRRRLKRRRATDDKALTS
ncbi:hypothetical protein ACFQQB_12980 [Nonomuraea rubra]|uniref:hypothetical protein n=1 Tax=Nonomuraea rubra TaxID=46180 RepID=UPI00362135DF